MELKTIKLIIWDLDDTFWNGTLSEGEVLQNSKMTAFLNNTLDLGIVHSICSKNDYETAKNQLVSFGLWDCFVFPSIDWTTKGPRILNIIQTMKLRAENVLFVDDNIQNLEEAKFYCPGIQVALPNQIEDLMEEARKAEPTDLKHKRLKQYQQMEQKELVKSEFASNEDFLMSCNIRVEICKDCISELDRIHELILRSNQLNYTKNRQEKDQLRLLLLDPTVDCGYVRAMDRFGDYGIVGFYAIKDGQAIHYVFSCRTLGMRVEQYVYQQICCPKIEIVGEVAAQLDTETLPSWINRETEQKKAVTVADKKSNVKMLLKGPCDMSQMYLFLQNNGSIVTEFSYTNDDGVLVEGHNHTAQIVTALELREERKNEILSQTEFFDKEMFETALKDTAFDVVVISMLTDGNLGVYTRKDGSERIALCKSTYPLTDESFADLYISGEVFTSGITFTEENLAAFSERYAEADWEVGQATVENLEKIRCHLGEKTKLVLVLGSEREFKKDCAESYADRHLLHAKMNAEIRKWAEGKENVVLLPIDKYVQDPSDFMDTINHYSKRVYYKLALDLTDLIAKTFSEDIKMRSKTFLLKETIKQRLREARRRIKIFMKSKQ